MLRNIGKIALSVGLGLAVGMPALAYDNGLAEGYAQLFAPVKGAKAGKAMHLMKPDVLVAKVRAGEPVVGLDIRTPTEAALFTAAMPGSMSIPLSELFVAENLDRLPLDRPIVVICKSGTRASAAGTALRHVGFDNVYVPQGGFTALSAYLDAKTANMPLGEQHAGR
jgi:rhodanese-related sulfurtransferase